MVVVRTHNGFEYGEHSVVQGSTSATFKVTPKMLELFKEQMEKDEPVKVMFRGPVSLVEMNACWKFPRELHVTTHCNFSEVYAEEPDHPVGWARTETQTQFNLGVQWLREGLVSLYLTDKTEGSGKPVTKLHEIP